MTLKRPYSIIDDANLEENITRAYAVKLESRFKRTSSGVEIFTYQSMEHGERNLSANGSANIVSTYALAEKHGRIVYASAHARNTSVIAAVTDVTGSSITITCVPNLSAASFSAAITASFTVNWQVVGSSP